MVIYEWKDYQYLGKVTSEIDDYLPVSIAPCENPTTRSCALLAENVRLYLRCRTRWILQCIRPRPLYSRLTEWQIYREHHILVCESCIP